MKRISVFLAVVALVFCHSPLWAAGGPKAAPPSQVPGEPTADGKGWKFPGSVSAGAVYVGGAHAAIAIEDKYIFADDTARTAYFVANPTELVDGRKVVITGVGEVQEYDLDTTSWVSLSTVVRGPGGADGDSAYVYIAYASDADGTGFTTTYSADLDYIAIKATDTAIAEPAAGDFAGLWKKYNGSDGEDGTPGDPGTPGEDGADAYVYVAYASDAAGTGFSLTPTDLLKYRAEIHSATEIAAPDAEDFSAATWVKYIGDDGASGTGTGDLLAANNLSDVANAATAFGNIKQAASETATGVVELATEAETTAGEDTGRAITPATLAAALALYELKEPSRLELTADTSINAAQLLANKYIVNQGASSTVKGTLPAVSYSVTRTIVVEEVQIFQLAPPSGEAFDLDGTTLTADQVVESGAVPGDKIVATRMKDASGAWTWSLDTVRGTWAAVE